MPVIVVGADTTLGGPIVEALLAEAPEVRAFVSDPAVGESLRALGAKVAVGDVSDETHVGGATARTFCAILLAEAAVDARERAFAATPEAVAGKWAVALGSSGTQRAIWVGAGDPAPVAITREVDEFAAVDPEGRSVEDVVADVCAVESADRLPTA